MNGSGSIRFSELFADTAATHGIEFAYQYYVIRRGMAYWEFRFWAKQSGMDFHNYYDHVIRN